MSSNNLAGVTPTANAPGSFADLEALLKDDIKVKVAGQFSVALSEVVTTDIAANAGIDGKWARTI